MASKSPRAMKRQKSKSCGKTRYRDAAAAKAALRKIREVGSVDPDGKFPVRWYHCDPRELGPEACNGYHTTSQE